MTDSEWTPDPAFSIDTPRLTISYFLPDNDAHCNFIVSLFNDPLFVARSGKSGVDTPEIARRFINGRVKGLHAKYGFGIYLVSAKEDGRPVGSVQMCQGDDFPVPDVGFMFVSPETGKGYATEAALALLEYAKKEYGVNEVLGFCNPTNEKSSGVLKRLGMEFRGTYMLKVFGPDESAVYALPGMKAVGEYGVA